jgi:hypothetical protein
MEHSRIISSAASNHSPTSGTSTNHNTFLCLWNRPTVQYHIKYCAAAVKRAEVQTMLLPQKNDDNDKDDEEENIYSMYTHDDGDGDVVKKSLRHTARIRQKYYSSSHTGHRGHNNCKYVPPTKHRDKDDRITHGTHENDGTTATKFSSLKNCNIPSTNGHMKEVTASLKHISIPPCDGNGFYHPSDQNITATIDIVLVAQVEKCQYKKEEDTAAFLRQKPLPDGYPGMKCKYCSDKRWFFNSYKQLATGLPKIEHHLMSQCVGCHESVKRNIVMSKKQETIERAVLRAECQEGKKMTRREYAQLVFGRLQQGGGENIVV